MNILLEKLKLLHRAATYRWRDDAAEIAYLLDKIKPGDTVFDIGAHKGGYTFWMQRAIGKCGTIIAFEPQRSGYHLLQQLFAENNIRIENKALSDTTGSAELFIQPQATAVSFEASLENKYVDAIKQTVEKITLDEYCQKQNLGPNLLKIDVEGYEMKVLEGGKKIITSTRPNILIEIEARHIGKAGVEDIFSWFRALDYAGYFFYMGQKTPLSFFDFARYQNLDLLKQPTLYCNNFVFETAI
ncbi:MAG: methyltransferase FkbM [Flaviaesturariibacter sp.]|nr:methyltransferase FkbM [Flaviaesturariibacter sp.]